MKVFLWVMTIWFAICNAQSVGLNHEIENPNFNFDLMVEKEDGHKVPLGEISNGKPMVLGFVYYGCASMCTLFLNGLISSLERAPEKFLPGENYHLAVLSIDHKENPGLARQKKEAVLEKLKGKIKPENWSFLTADSLTISKLTSGVGFTFQKVEGGYSHTSALFIANKQGRVGSIIEGQSFFPMEIGLGVQVAKSGAFSPIVKRFVEFCFVKDPAGRGMYFDFLKVIGICILVIIISTVWILTKLIRRRQINEVELEEAVHGRA